MSAIGVLRLESVPAARLAAISRGALDRRLRQPAELLLATLSDEAVVLGALQRASELSALSTEPDAPRTLLRRGSCGAEVRVGPGSLWMQLALERTDALVAGEPGRLLNRHVRPVLRALTKVGALAHYFDRDWISVAKRPVGMIALSHDATSRRALVEIVIAATTPFAVRARPSYLGKPAATLSELGLDVDLARLGDAIAQAHADAYGGPLVELEPGDEGETFEAEGPRGEPSWTATCDEAIGVVGAGRDRTGRMRLGGELMVSRDAIAALEEQLVTALEPAAIGRAVDATLAAPGVALIGVKSRLSLRDVIARATGPQVV